MFPRSDIKNRPHCKGEGKGIVSFTESDVMVIWVSAQLRTKDKYDAESHATKMCA